MLEPEMISKESSLPAHPFSLNHNMDKEQNKFHDKVSYIYVTKFAEFIPTKMSNFTGIV
jgi:hypothetical protein